VGQPEDAGRLAEAGGQLGLQPVLADAHAAVEIGGRPDALLDLPRRRLRVVGLDSQECLVPAEHLDDGIDFVQRRHDVGRGSLVELPVDGQEHRSGASPGRGPQRNPGVHAVFAGFVRGGADHAALGWVAITTDDHRAPAEFGTAQRARQPR